MNNEDAAAGAVLEFKGRLSYGDYLHLDELLESQRPRTDAHDEMLFIIQHQTTELWFRLVQHELDMAMAGIDADELGPAFKALARVERIFRVLLDAWSVLATMTPADYMQFRNSLDAASGFQSHQYRLLEFTLGNKDPLYMRPFEHLPEVSSRLQTAYHSPSIYDRAIALLARRGLSIDADVLGRDVSRPYVPNDSVTAAWRTVYLDTEHSWDLYELAEKLVDFEEALRQWRFRHVSTVQRIIGAKPGTGGTAGVQYLRERLNVVLFPELWMVRTDL